MSDPRLNSIHLDGVRRDEFRKIRAEMLDNMGEETRRSNEVNESLTTDRTLYHSLKARIPDGQEFVLLDKDKPYPLKLGINTVGRMSDNDVALPDPYLSRRHCAIMVHTDGTCEIYDVASKNGTFLNGEKLEGRHPLKSGDEIRMCDRQFVFARKSDLEGDNPPGDFTLKD
ncbi:MAG: FHA domain-containing protein [Gemmataceae bacterium]